MSMDLNPEIVCHLIDLATEFHAKEDVSFPDSASNPSDDDATQVLADHQDDPSYQTMVATIEDLEPDQQITLVALMWMGRGDFTLEEWDEALEQAAAEHNDRTADYLIATPLVADYWREGLNLHEYSCGE
ncbi:DUF3775 domain-containing protein [Gilvimarinus sp. F26214L]|uniref:DUF3775 domain-containing protein n=1 Tax=Gilvimarinus sp. DZF01 TaxID=3461371 RepID=UPI004046372D